MGDSFSSEELSADPETFTGDFAWLYAYWAERAGAGGLADWADIRLVDFPATLLPLLVIMDVVDDDRSFVFRYWGTERTNLQGVDMTGKSVRDLTIPGLADAMIEQNQRAVDARAPILFRNCFLAPSGLVIEYLALRLPVLDGENVGKILALSQFIRNRTTVFKPGEDGPLPA